MRFLQAVLFKQAAVLLAITFLSWVITFDSVISGYVGVGGFIAWVPSWIFGWFFFQSGRVTPRQMLNGLYLGEGLKFLLTVLLWGLMCRVLPHMNQHMGAVFVGLVTMWMSHGLAWVGVDLGKNIKNTG